MPFKMTYEVSFGGKVYNVKVEEASENYYRVEVNGQKHEVDTRKVDGRIYSFIINGKSCQAWQEEAEDRGNELSVCLDGTIWRAKVENAEKKGVRKPRLRKISSRHILFAPIPGKVVEVSVSEGDKVKKGQGLIVLEAMKMENELASPSDGDIKEISVKEGQTVKAGMGLLVVEDTGAK